MNTSDLESIVDQIVDLPPEWHAAGSMSPKILRAMAKHCADKNIERSVETGVGKSTLLLSQVSANHKVFAIDGGGSLTATRQCRLLAKEHVEFIEGPTQQTIPKHAFEGKLQFALIDGPHAYPFAELEYYFIYPLLDEGAIFVIDDIHIPTIYNMFQFMKKDGMYELLEVVQNTAFFQRTGQEAFNPLGDGWEHQPYNMKTKWADRSLSGAMKRMIPQSLHKPLRTYLYNKGLWR